MHYVINCSYFYRGGAVGDEIKYNIVNPNIQRPGGATGKGILQ